MSRERKYFTVGKLRAWVAAASVCAVMLGAFASSASALPANFWGVVPQAVPSVEHIERLKAGGVETMRIPIGWSVLQADRNQPVNFTPVDEIVEKAAKGGINLLPFVSGAPSWVVATDKQWGSPVTLPVRNPVQIAAWKNFLKETVERYGPAGDFWAQHPAVPYKPIRTWQIWNEPNFKYFVARPNPADYGKLVKTSSTTIKAIDPGAKIVLGGLFARPIEATKKLNPPQAYFAGVFLDKMYKATPGIKAKFQGVALHPYTGTWQKVGVRIEEVRDTLSENGDAAKKLWLTELGWSSGPPASDGKNSFAKGPAGQARELRGAFKMLVASQAKWRVQSVYWFSVDDAPEACNFCDGSGLFAKGFKPKKSWFEYVKFSGGTP